jgi:hypothetical protein
MPTYEDGSKQRSLFTSDSREIAPTVEVNDERTRTTRLSDDGTHLIIVERWLDHQWMPPRRASKNWRRKLKPNEIEYYRQRLDEAAG